MRLPLLVRRLTRLLLRFFRISIVQSCMFKKTVSPVYGAKGIILTLEIFIAAIRLLRRQGHVASEAK